MGSENLASGLGSSRLGAALPGASLSPPVGTRGDPEPHLLSTHFTSHPAPRTQSCSCLASFPPQPRVSRGRFPYFVREDLVPSKVRPRGSRPGFRGSFEVGQGKGAAVGPGLRRAAPPGSDPSRPSPSYQGRTQSGGCLQAPQGAEETLPSPSHLPGSGEKASQQPPATLSSPGAWVPLGAAEAGWSCVLRPRLDPASSLCSGLIGFRRPRPGLQGQQCGPGAGRGEASPEALTCSAPRGAELGEPRGAIQARGAVEARWGHWRLIGNPRSASENLYSLGRPQSFWVNLSGCSLGVRVPNAPQVIPKAVSSPVGGRTRWPCGVEVRPALIFPPLSSGGWEVGVLERGWPASVQGGRAGERTAPWHWCLALYPSCRSFQGPTSLSPATSLPLQFLPRPTPPHPSPPD